MRQILKEGQKINRLLVLKRDGKAKDGKPLWLCLCDCGQETHAKNVELTSNKKKSCGCLRHENNSNLSHGDGSITKGKAGEYVAWQAVIQRCCNHNSPNYHNYGGRGIKVCKRWRNSYVFFLKDMGRKPTRKHSLDRIDVNGDYEPSNCRWITIQEQQWNKRDNRWIEHNGQNRILVDWAEQLETSSSNILSKLKMGKPFSEIYDFYINKMGKDKSITEIIGEVLNDSKRLSKWFKKYKDAIKIEYCASTKTGFLVTIDIDKINK